VTARLEYENRYLALTAVGYQFDDPVRADVGMGDAKWLDVKVAASDGSTTWERIEACFSDGELHDLVGWLRALGSGDSGDASFEAVEPSLQFKAIWGAGYVRLNALFNLELHPDGRHHYDMTDPKVLSFELPRSAVERFANALENDLSRFPKPRGGRPER